MTGVHAMRITTDWHIHSRSSCDSACMTIADMIQGAKASGITDFGVTDHLQTPINLPDLEASRREFDACDPDPRFHFGVEVSSVSKWELEELPRRTFDSPPIWGIRDGGPEGAEPTIGLTQADIDRLGIEFVVGGVHWPMYVPFEREAIIDDSHRQNMMLATHQLVDIVAHSWWWLGQWADDNTDNHSEQWYNGFTVIPQSMHEEFAKACIEHNTAVEINLYFGFDKRLPPKYKYQYLDYLAILKDGGVTFSIGSDCHAPHLDADYEAAALWLEPLGLRDEDFWCLPPRDTA
jgi:histidinol phosphatase-like PHP family hydrolase